jgi:Flp pilus assembly pilin Flp
MLTGSGVDTGDPQAAEDALLVAAIAVSVLAGAHDCLLGNAVYLAAATTVAFSLNKNFLMTGTSCNPTFYSRHSNSLN